MKRQIVIAAGVVGVMAAFALVWQFTPLSAYLTPEAVSALIERFRDSPLAGIAMIGIFIVGGICFFPLTVLTIATAMTFGPIAGIVITLVGGLLSAMVTYGIGALLAAKGLRSYMSSFCDQVQARIENTGIIGMTILRLVFIAPYSMVNMAFGILSVSFVSFITSLFLALLPGAIIRSILGDAMLGFWKRPDGKNITYLFIGCAVWVGVLLLSHIVVHQRRGLAPPTGNFDRSEEIDEDYVTNGIAGTTPERRLLS